ncbi:MAG: MlaD family protein [Solirubrobacteraceae bacterium]
MRGRRAPSVAANPVFIGAVTTLVVIAAVLLAYNANKGLPFVPTFELKVDTPNAARLVIGNEVREGGFRIGQVTKIAPVRSDDGRSGAQLTLKLDKSATPLPEDSTIRIRPRSALGLKYVELVRGTSGTALEEGEVIATKAGAVPPELDDFFAIFDEPTRQNVERVLDYFGTALAGRGRSVNQTLAALPDLFGDLPPVMRNLAAPDTQLVRMLRELEDGARIVAPLSDTLAGGFTGMADTFGALSVDDGQPLRDTIERSPGTLAEGIFSLPLTRPFLARLAGISDELRASAAELRLSLPAINRALAAGIPVLRRTPQFNRKLERTLAALRELAESPTTDVTLRGLRTTVSTLNPTLQWVGPHQTVCNYFNYWWTHLSDHLSEEDATGTLQRIQVKFAPLTQPNSMAEFGRPGPANGGSVDPITHALQGDAAAFHGQDYSRAVDENGNADCESGQRGYPDRLATGFSPSLNIVTDPRSPGNQGPTFKGRARIPAGQTFSAEPTGIAPPVVLNP